ncbi:MAG: hypothetical protein J7500_13415 [Sphingomonas sp.]|uniref:DUF5818 domain-containing protein n=1 Tax=Sphingomonas sp. TaxID=28214 RepID=UPI001B295EC3|nr:DUF5818 domain-containing protein [Sphingomonas sp.]MBO9623699.1 hypothetical protein [Sphingomonas sp.]
MDENLELEGTLLRGPAGELILCTDDGAERMLDTIVLTADIGCRMRVTGWIGDSGVFVVRAIERARGI